MGEDESIDELARQVAPVIEKYKNITGKASDEALEYIESYLQGDIDRSTHLSRNAHLMGVASVLSNHVAYVHEDMQKRLKKRPFKVDSDTANILADIYLARVLSTVMDRLADDTRD